MMTAKKVVFNDVTIIDGSEIVKELSDNVTSLEYKLNEVLSTLESLQTLVLVSNRQLRRLLIRQERMMTEDVKALVDELTRQGTVEDGIEVAIGHLGGVVADAVTEIEALLAQIAANADEPAVVRDLTAQVRARTDQLTSSATALTDSTAQLANAVVANTGGATSGSDGTTQPPPAGDAGAGSDAPADGGETATPMDTSLPE